MWRCKIIGENVSLLTGFVLTGKCTSAAPHSHDFNTRRIINGF